MENTHPAIAEALLPFHRLSEICLAHLAEAPENGNKVAGVYCAFAPEELIRALGILPVSLCGKDEKPISVAETHLPAALCPLIKSSYGFALSDTCPYFAASDVIIGETTCDGKKKMFELMGKMKPVHVMQLPYAVDNSSARTFWREEILRLKTFLEKQTARKVTDAALTEQIELINLRNSKLMKLADMMAADVPPISGRELLKVMESRNVAIDIASYNGLLDNLLSTIDSVAGKTESKKKPRILITGCPMGSGSDKVMKIIEDLGGIVVAQEHCGGLKSIFRHIDTGTNLLNSLADHYLGTPCACMSPNTRRLDYLLKLCEQFTADAVIDATLQNCHPYTVEHQSVATLIEEKAGIPVFHVNTGYSPSDTEQIRVRVEAFLEML
ncbi:double-cubane-cluster-containing anaerobic reductase [Desulforhopalus sp. IMCC35007]|uniref:double-cubane-cluster-containing anaerobic reductase n=1 Tax=Desulforhopalus sp. IMCC35007 TaxID=2569543 RepID=UPI0010ADBE1D|nr:double-cubane-cluster-containing anaerobic reductase [Desulforhopalus sp. IMCC35007]TKB11797.1 2-hydroxyacyl-CoA dehydratase [Desulforhopalus sp. IMCC35007]